MKKIIFIIAAVALLASPAMAVDWNFYGSARMATFYQSRDFKDTTASDISGQGSSPLAGAKKKDDNIDWKLQGNSRLGATVKAENIGGRFEFGITDDNGGGNVTSRRIYGTWDFGAATLKVGKDYTPVAQFVSGQVFDGDLGLLGQGASYGSRRGQVALSFGGFEVALVTNDSSGLLRNMTTGDVDNYLPKIEAKYGMSFDTWNFAVNGGYMTYKIQNAGVALRDKNVNSFTLGADAGVTFGPATIRGAISGGRNVGVAGWHITEATNLTAWDGTSIKDVDTIQGLLAAVFKFTDQLQFEIGAGYRQDKSDLQFEDKDENWTFYANSVITMAPGVFLVPEIGYRDFKDNISDISGVPNEEGKLFYLGAKWQINF